MKKEQQTELLKYFTGPHRNGVKEFKSPYIAALIDARIATGRNKKTGRKLQKKSHGSWVGALGYMALLDHLGKIASFKNQRRQDLSKNNYIKCLQNFTSLNSLEIDAMYALRCAFAHDYSLYNIPESNKRESLLHHFRVTQGIDGKGLVTLPTVRWNKKFEDCNDEQITIINLELLGDLVENINKQIIEGIKNQNIEFANNSNILFICYDY